MKIAKVKHSFKMYANNYPIPVFLKGGERYLMSDYVLTKLKEITSPDNLKEEKGEWSFDRVFKKYEGQDLSGKTLLSWRSGGIGDFSWIGAAARTLKNKYPNCHFIMGCSPQYRPLIDACVAFDETYSMPLNAKLLKRAAYHCTYENAIEHNPRAEILNAYDLIAERLHIKYDDSKEFPIEWKRPYLKPQKEATEKLNLFWKTIDVDKSAMKIGVQVKTSSPIRTPDFNFMISLIRTLKERWPEAYIFIFGSPAQWYIEQVQRGIDFLKLPRIVNWLRLFQDLAVTIALVKELDLTIAPDSAINHISAAFDVPNVGIFGPFRPEVRLSTYPYSDWVTFDYKKWICAPCFQHSDDACEISKANGIADHAICLDDITISDIMKKVDIVLNRKKRGIPRWEDK